MSDLSKLSVFELSHLISSRDISPVDLYISFSSRIEQYGNKLNCFLEVFDDWESKAKNAAQEISAKGAKSPLHGIPIVIKDLIDFKGKVTTAGSRIMLENYAKKSAEIVNSLESSGAIIVGKASLVEFAFGPHGVNSSLPPTRNPWDLERIPGGSSSGSAVAVASNLSPLAIGSDTGGSIRMPASFCGVTGFKPSYNKLNTKGVFPLSWSLDTVGPIAKTTKDCAIFVEEVCKHQSENNDNDPFNGFDTTMLDNFDSLLPVRLRIGVPSDEYFSDLEDDVREVFTQSIDLMKSNGAEIVEIDLSWLSIARPINLIISNAEALEVHSKWLASKHENYTYEVLSRLVAGENLYLNNYFSALRAMNYVQKKIENAFEKFDVIACPTTPELPGLIDEYSKENLMKSQKVIGGRIPAFTSLFNVTRQPSLSTRAGFSQSGLPIGIMFTGRFNKDFGVLQVGNWFEKLNHLNRSQEPVI